MPNPRTHGRIVAIDYIKAIAICAVVLTHSGPYLLGPDATSWDRIVRSHWTPFHVPAFFLISGFLYFESGPVPWSTIARRLMRLLPPYLVASVFVQLLGLSRAGTPGEVLFQLLTGASLGIYYFVFLLALFVLSVAALSRLSDRTLLLLLVLLAGHTVATAIDPRLEPSATWFWRFRDPLHQFRFGFFLTGWLAARHLPRLRSLRIHHLPLVWVLTLGGLAVWSVATAGLIPRSGRSVYLVAFTLSVCSLITLVTARRSLPEPVRWLSEASLTIYLYHRIAILLLLPATTAWPPAVRTLCLFGVGLAFSASIVWIGRRFLGNRPSRMLLGA